MKNPLHSFLHLFTLNIEAHWNILQFQFQLDIPIQHSSNYLRRPQIFQIIASGRFRQNICGLLRKPELYIELGFTETFHEAHFKSKGFTQTFLEVHNAKPNKVVKFEVISIKLTLCSLFHFCPKKCLHKTLFEQTDKKLRNRPLCQCTAAPTIYFFSSDISI